MPVTLILKDIPDDVYEKLLSVAEIHRRSLDKEAIVCLETVLLPRKISASERIVRARMIRASLKQGAFLAQDIDAFKQQGRA